MAIGMSNIPMFLVYFRFVYTDEDPALRELAEMERESCLHDIQELSKKVQSGIFIFKQSYFYVESHS